MHVQQNGRRVKCLRASLPASLLAAEEANAVPLSVPRLFCRSLPQFTLSPVALWYYPTLLDFPFVLSPYALGLGWTPPAQALLGSHGISVSSVLAAQTLRTRRGAFRPGFLGISDQMTS